MLADVSPTWQIAIPKSKKGDVGSTVSARLSGKFILFYFL